MSPGVRSRKPRRPSWRCWPTAVGTLWPDTMALWASDQPLVLASKSEVRRKIVEVAGIPVEVHPAEIDERSIEADAGSAPSRDIARMLALVKARTVADAMPGRLVLGADQTLAFGSETLSKPVDMAAARAQLLRMRGLTHEL